MKLKKIIIAGAIGLLAVTASVGTSTEASAKTKVVKVKKASQVKKATKKALKYYNGGTAYRISGKSKYVKKVNNAVISDIKAKNGIKWCPTPTTSSKKSLKKYKEGVKYLGLIVKDINAEYEYAWTTYNVYFTQYNKATESEVMSEVIVKYCGTKMDYLRGEPDICPVTDYKKIYKGTYKRDCGGYTRALVNIIQAIGYKARKERTSPTHILPQMQVQNVDGNVYWRNTSPFDRASMTSTQVFIPISIEDMNWRIENGDWK